MSEIEDSKDNIVNQLMKIKKRLDKIHSSIACFIFITVLFYVVIIIGMIYW